MNRPDAGYPYVQEQNCRDYDGLSNAGGPVRRLARRNCRWPNALLAAALLLLMPRLAAAQGNAVRPRIADRVDDTRLTVLQGNTHPLARAQYDRGSAPPNLPMDRMLLVLKRSPEQETALKDLLEQQQDTSSPNFHKWLTPDLFGKQFGPADQDIQVVTSWLTSRGFQSVQVSKGRTVIEFSGTAGQVQSALHTAIHKYVVNAEEHWANATDPQIPAALAPVVAGILSLHNFPKKPMSVHSGRKVTATATLGLKPQINFTGGTHGLTPADFNVIYNVGSTMTGAGATIGVIARSNFNVSDVSKFRSFFGLPVNDPQVILNGPDPGNLRGGEEAEAVLDATWPGAVAPNATVKMVVSADTNSTQGVDLSEFYIIDNDLADVLTESFSTCEGLSGLTQATALLFATLPEQAAAQGITYLVASGDGGPDGCDPTSPLPAMPAAASVNLLASTPFTVAVGGTQFNDLANPSLYWKPTNGTNSESAISYIPEDVWNETSASAGLLASGGGQSALFTKPPWQAGVAGIPTADARFLPDVSLTAADHDGYVLCITDLINPTCQGPTPSFNILSGTSASVEAFGGVMALVVQKTGTRQGQANYVLYKLAASEVLSSCNGSSTTTPPISTCIFNDTTIGDTNIPGEAGFAATVGYDQATGLGSVNVSNLVNKWSTAIVNASTTTLSLNNGAAVNFTHGQQIPVNITVAAKAPATGTPTGDVSLIGNSSMGGGADSFTLTNGSVNSSAIFLPGGTYNVTAHYAGDGTFTGSDSNPVNVTISPEASQTMLGIVVSRKCATATSIVYGSVYNLSVAVTDAAAGAGTVCFPLPSGAPASGPVTLTDNGAALDGGLFNLNSLGFFEDQRIQLTAGTHSLLAVYGGDNSFSGSTSSTDVVTVTQATPTTTVTANPTSVPAGGTVTLTATVSTMSTATANAQQEPTGTVQFFLGVVAFGSPVSVTGGVDSITKFAQAVAVKSTATLANGQYAITAQYLGDSNYAPSVISAQVTVSVGPGISLSPASNTATINISAPGQSGTQTITATAANGFTGTVALTCAVTPTNLSDVPTCSFTPSSTITLTTIATSGQSALTVNTMAKSSLFKPTSRPRSPNWFLLAEVATFMACFSLLVFSKRKRQSPVVLAMLIFAVIAVVGGCGTNSGGGGGGSNPGTTLGAYTVTVTATPSSGSPQTTAIAVNVQ